MDTKIEQNVTSLPYRDCVGIVVFDQEGKVFFGKRFVATPTSYDSEAALWQFPQGGIDEGEDPLSAAYREIYEETGMKSLRLLGKIDEWICYDLPQELLGKALKGAYKGQRQKWFAFLLLGDKKEIQVSPPPLGHTIEFEEWDFVDLESVADNVISFKKEVYQKVIKAFIKFSGKDNIFRPH